MKLSNIIGKQVFSLYEGEIVGTVCGVVFNYDNTKLSFVKIFDSEENEFMINFSSIKAFGQVVIIANRQKLSNLYNAKTKTPIFKCAINDKAEELGKIIDCEILEKGIISHFYTDKNLELNPKFICLRKNFVYYTKVKSNLKNIYPKNNLKKLEQIKVKILPFDTTNIDTNFTPNKIQFNTDTIIGKIVKNTLLGINNEIIIKANEQITEKTIINATKHNRLNQLYFLAI